MDEEVITQVRDALEEAGLHTWEIGDGIINVHSAPATDGADMPDQATYLYTVTVTKTP